MTRPIAPAWLSFGASWVITAVLVFGCSRVGSGQASASSPSASSQPATTQAARTPPSPQPRRSGVRVPIDPASISVDDGDTILVRGTGGDVETIRLLGIDCPEVVHLEHDLPYAQPFGEQALAFARGAFAAATRVELLRAATLDPYGRTLGYVFLNGRNYSVLVIEARLAEQTITRFGDNGFPEEARQVQEAARRAGPLPFESPTAFRARMRELSRWMKERGVYPPP